MDVNLGIYLRKSDREAVLTPLPPRMRSWGDEMFEEEGPQRFSALELEGAEFEIYSSDGPVLDDFPADELGHELEYAYMTGCALDAYEQWAQENVSSPDLSEFEQGLAALLHRLQFWALVFAPESDRLEETVTVDVKEVIQKMRRGAEKVWDCDGFLAFKLR